MNGLLLPFDLSIEFLLSRNPLPSLGLEIHKTEFSRFFFRPDPAVFSWLLVTFAASFQALRDLVEAGPTGKILTDSCSSFSL